MPSTIDRYLLREVVKTLLAFLSVLLLILFATTFIRFLRKVASGDLAAQILLEFIGLEILRNLSVLIPPAFFFSILFTLARMHRDNEVVVLEACGVGPLRIFRSVLMASLPVALVVAWLATSVLPWGNRMMQVLKHEAEGAAAELALIEPGRFNEYSAGDLVFYVETVDTDKQTMSNIFVQNREHGKVGLVTAAAGYRRVDAASGDIYLVLTDGKRYEGTIGNSDYRIASFEEYALRVRRSTQAPRTARRKERPTKDLLSSKSLEDQAEGQNRLMQPLAVLAFALLSIPLSRSRPRQGTTARMVLAFLVYFVFLNLLGVSQNLMEDAVTPRWLGLWWVPGSMLLVGLVLMALDTRQGRSWRRRWLRVPGR